MHPTHPRPCELLRAVERVWHSLLLMVRTDEAVVPNESRRELGPRLEAFAQAGEAYLTSLGRALARNSRAPPPHATAESGQARLDGLRQLQQQGTTRSLDGQEAERVFTLAFVIQQLSRNLDELVGLLPDPSAMRGER